MAKDIKVIIADAHHSTLEVTKLIIGSHDEMTVIQTCETSNEAIVAAKQLLPDIMLIDINLSPDDGFETVRKITENTPAVKIIGFAAYEEPAYALKMLGKGANGYITKTSPMIELLEGILQVYDGHLFICKEVRNKMKGIT